MVASAHDQSYTPGDAHPLNRPCMRKLHHYFHRRWGRKWNRLRHRPVRYPGFPRQNRSVRHKRGESHGRKQPSRFLLVLRQFRDFFHLLLLCSRIGFIKTRARHALRQKFKQNLNQFPGIDRPSVCRKSDFHSDQNASILRFCHTRGSLQNLLAAPADCDQPALSRTSRLKIVPFHLGGEFTKQQVLQRHPFMTQVIGLCRKTGFLSLHPDADPGRRRKRVALHMVDA